jgi:HEAT repeats
MRKLFTRAPQVHGAAPLRRKRYGLPLLLLLPCLLSTPAGAQERAPTASRMEAQEPLSTEEASEDPRTRRRKRLLRTSSGQVIRGNTRYRDGHWELSRQGKWVALADDAIVSYRIEAEVRDEQRKLARGVGPKDHERRVALATWMFDQGLEEEALEELDRVLHVEPDHPAAVRLLRTAHVARPQVGDPEADPERYVGQLFVAALSATPTKRELCVQAMGELLEVEGGREVLSARLSKELVSYRVLCRVTAAHALRRLMPGENVRELLRRCALDTSRPVRESAALALRATDEPGVIVPLVRALGSESRAVRTNAAESLGKVGFNAAVPALVSHFANLPQSGGGGITPSIANIYIGLQFAYVGDFDVEIAQGASIADPIVSVGDSGVVLDARVGGISGYTYSTEYRVVNSALQQLTGEKPGSSPADWQRWFAGNEQRFAQTPDEKAD